MEQERVEMEISPVVCLFETGPTLEQSSCLDYCPTAFSEVETESRLFSDVH